MSKSIWNNEIKAVYPKLEQDISVNVIVVGGGIAGMSTAYNLVKNGLKVAVLEKDEIGNKNTGTTTAQLTAQHDLIYSYIDKEFGINQAKLYLEAQLEAIQDIVGICDEDKIDCDLEMVNSYIYTNEEKHIKLIKHEYEVLKEIDYDAIYTKELETSIPMKAAVGFKDQYNFHPVKYIHGLAKKIAQSDSAIYENTRVVDFEYKYGKHIVTTANDKKVTAPFLVIATSNPIINFPGLYFMKVHDERSYVVSFSSNSPINGSFSSIDSTAHYLRTQKGKIMLGGYEHRTGEKEDTMLYMNMLKEDARKMFGEDIKFDYEWSAQDGTTVDGLPYIGNYSRTLHGAYVICGFNKWGMSNSQVAANIICDLILDRPNDYMSLFKPQRCKPITSFTSYLEMVKYSTLGFIDKLHFPSIGIEDVHEDEGKVISYKNKRVGAYRDSKDQLHLVVPKCKHLGCELVFNPLEKTWDCPCHASRYDINGKMIDGPSVHDLDIITYEHTQD